MLMFLFLGDFGLFGNKIQFQGSILLQQANNSRTWVDRERKA